MENLTTFDGGRSVYKRHVMIGKKTVLTLTDCCKYFMFSKNVFLLSLNIKHEPVLVLRESKFCNRPEQQRLTLLLCLFRGQNQQP